MGKRRAGVLLKDREELIAGSRYSCLSIPIQIHILPPNCWTGQWKMNRHKIDTQFLGFHGARVEWFIIYSFVKILIVICKQWHVFLFSDVAPLPSTPTRGSQNLSMLVFKMLLNYSQSPNVIKKEFKEYCDNFFFNFSFWQNFTLGVSDYEIQNCWRNEKEAICFSYLTSY